MVWTRMIPVVVFLVSALAAAQMQIAHVKGNVFDREGKPIKGATIIYKNRVKGTSFKTTTDEKGEYFRMGVPPDEYDVVLVVNGREMMQVQHHLVYVTGKMGIDVRNHENWNYLDLDLRTKAGEELAYARVAITQQPEDIAAEAERKKQAQIKSAMTAGGFDLQNGSLETAITRFKEVIGIAPEHAPAWGRLGEAYAAQNKHEEAIAQFKKAITLSPGEASFHAGLAASYAATNRPDVAVDGYRNAARFDPKSKTAYLFSAAAVLTNAGKRKEAIALFAEVLDAEPENPAAVYYKAVNELVLWDTGGRKGSVPQPAIAGLQRYLELEPEGEFAADCRQKLAAVGTSAKK